LGIGMNGTHQVSTYVYVNLIGDDIITLGRNAHMLLLINASKGRV
jgi:hypothetical protein